MAKKLTNEELNFLVPIKRVRVHRNGNLTIVRKPRFQPEGKPPKRKVNDITKLSSKSLRRLNNTMQCTSVTFQSMITLTYGEFYPNNGKQVKDDIGVILRYLRKYGSEYLWFLEFQARGAPHVHIMSEAGEITPSMRVNLAYKWVQRQVQQEYFYANCPIGQTGENVYKLMKFNVHPKVWELIHSKDGAARYVSKYACKKEQKKVPSRFKDVGRFWGCSSGVSTIDGVEVDIEETELRELLEKHCHPMAKAEILPKYIWGVVDR